VRRASTSIVGPHRADGARRCAGALWGPAPSSLPGVGAGRLPMPVAGKGLISTA